MIKRLFSLAIAAVLMIGLWVGNAQPARADSYSGYYFADEIGANDQPPGWQCWEVKPYNNASPARPPSAVCMDLEHLSPDDPLKDLYALAYDGMSIMTMLYQLGPENEAACNISYDPTVLPGETKTVNVVTWYYCLDANVLANDSFGSIQDFGGDPGSVHSVGDALASGLTVDLTGRSSSSGQPSYGLTWAQPHTQKYYRADRIFGADTALQKTMQAYAIRPKNFTGSEIQVDFDQPANQRRSGILTDLTLPPD